MKSFFDTRPTWSAMVLRLGLAGVILPHGFGKLLGWFGGFGFSGTMGFFTHKMHIPAPLAFLVIIGESLGSVALLLGFLTRFVAVSFVMIMLGAIFLVHIQNGFFMNWYGTKAGEGYEYHLLVIAMSISLLLSGGGKASVDGVIAEKLDR